MKILFYLLGAIVGGLTGFFLGFHGVIGFAIGAIWAVISFAISEALSIREKFRA